jgi:hypothetical protein
VFYGIMSEYVHIKYRFPGSAKLCYDDGGHLLVSGHAKDAIEQFCFHLI